MRKGVWILGLLVLAMLLVGCGSPSAEREQEALSFAFSDLAPGEYALGTVEYCIEDTASGLHVICATWNSQAEEIGIGWYNVETQDTYLAYYRGGSAADVEIDPGELPAGNYKVGVWNLGDEGITGAIQYSIS